MLISKVPNLFQTGRDVLKIKFLAIAALSVLSFNCLFAQEETNKSFTISLFTGLMNYQGDLNPTSFRFAHSNFNGGIIVRKPLSSLFTIRAGVNIGTIKAHDKSNSDYLKIRNLSFTSTVKEAYAALELTVPNLANERFTPYLYVGIAIFNFNPWTYDNSGAKIYLKPLSTEGQGLTQYPTKKPYNLTQLAIPYGAGMKFAISDGLALGVEFNHRKTFTDYLDDVSSNFVDRDVLLQARGAKAVELSYRGDELPNGSPLFPTQGDQRGTPTRKDWYYFFGVTMEFKLRNIDLLFRNNKPVANQRCPTRF